MIITQSPYITLGFTFGVVCSMCLDKSINIMTCCCCFDLGHTFRSSIRSYHSWSSGFPCFLQFKSEFGNKELMIWATVSSRSCFCWLYRASASLAAKNIINLISVLTIWWCPCVESSLVLLEEGVCYDQCILLAKLY